MNMKLDIQEIISAAGAKVVKEGPVREITGVSTDTRTLLPKDLFVAIKGPHFDGHDFINDAIQKGASGVVVSREASFMKREAWTLQVADTIHALGDIAACWRKKIAYTTVIAVTGSNGKSTTKEMIATALSDARKVIKTEGNFNNLIGLPLQIMRILPEHEVAVLEMGMNAPGEIKRLTEIANPDVGIITNVNPAHLERLHTIENVACAKGELFETMRSDGTVVINAEDPWVVKLGNKYSGKKITFGMQNGCDVQFGRMTTEGLKDVSLTFYARGGREYAMCLPWPGWHNAMNALAAIAVGVSQGVAVTVMISQLEHFKPTMKMRMERVQLLNGVQLINDTYNANPASMQAALRTVSAAKRSGRFIAVFGDMLELGEAAELKHKELGEMSSDAGVFKLFVFGEYAGAVSDGAKAKGLSNVQIFDDVNILSKDLKSEIKTGDVVLVKGSRGMKMERVVEYLKNEIGI